MNRILELDKTQERKNFFNEIKWLARELFGELSPIRQRKYFHYLQRCIESLAYTGAYLSPRNKMYYRNPAFSHTTLHIAKECDRALGRAGYVVIEDGWNERYATPEERLIHKGKKNRMTRLVATGKFFESALYKAWLAAVEESEIPYTEHLAKDDEVELRQITPLTEFSEFLNGAGIVFNGERRKVALRRIAKGTILADGVEYLLGGRLYCQFENGYFSYQSLPAKERLTMTIGGEEVVSVDFVSLAPRILYNHFLKLPLEGDVYAIHHHDNNREINKLLFFYLLDGFTTVGNLERVLKWKYQSRFEDTEPKIFDTLHSLFTDLKDVRLEYLAAFLEHFKSVIPLTKDFPCSLSLIEQGLDSTLMLNICNRLMEEGIPVLPVHDECICRKSDEVNVQKVMREEYQKLFGYAGLIKTTLKGGT